MSWKQRLQDNAALRIAAVIVLIALLVLTGVRAQSAKPFVFGEVRELNSTALGQQRTINVYLPDGYNDTLRYPVIYVLDGSANEDFPHIAGLMQFLNMYELAPKSIVVGIANVDRRHDFTSPTQDDSDKVWVPTGGGSAAFIAFIGDELVPFVDRTYHTTKQRTIIGQSLGGLLATEILLTRSELFTDYILVSPSLWWNKGALAAQAPAWAKAHAAAPLRIFITSAPDDAMMRSQIDQLTYALSGYARPPLQWWYEPMPGESHMTILHRAVYRAFEVMYPAKD